MKKQNQSLMLPTEILSSQQKQIYNLYRQGFSNKEIAFKLNTTQRSVATQLSRIRKKAAGLAFTYKIEPGAEHAQLPVRCVSPADELKKRIRDDPGFFALLYDRYASNGETTSENRYRLATAGRDPALLSNTRAKQIKALAVSGRDTGQDRVTVKMDKNTRQALRDFLRKQKIQPLQVYWDDGSAVFLVSNRDLNKMQQLLEKYT